MAEHLFANIVHHAGHEGVFGTCIQFGADFRAFMQEFGNNAHRNTVLPEFLGVEGRGFALESAYHRKGSHKVNDRLQAQQIDGIVNGGDLAVKRKGRGVTQPEHLSGDAWIQFDDAGVLLGGRFRVFG